jgi:hypothetical protein
MSRAQRRKRVLDVEVGICARCGDKLKVIASIEQPEIIAKFLAHLENTAPDHEQTELPLGARAPANLARPAPHEGRASTERTAAHDARCDGRQLPISGASSPPQAPPSAAAAP